MTDLTTENRELSVDELTIDELAIDELDSVSGGRTLIQGQNPGVGRARSRPNQDEDPQESDPGAVRLERQDPGRRASARDRAGPVGQASA